MRDNRLRIYQDRRYDWDRFGRLCRKRIGHHTEQRFRYDAEHRLVAVDIQDRQGAHSVRFDYDPIGRRIAKTHVRADGRTLGATEFLWDGMRLAGERSASQQSLYLYADEGSHEALARVDGIGAHQQVLHFHADANGAPEEMTDGEGRLLWQVRYRVWGNTLREEYHPTQLAPQNLRFQGQYLDRETGLHYNTFRFFDPDIGRFTTTDPIGLAGGFNLYQYAPNPVTWIDPWGWCTKAFKSKLNKIRAAAGKPGNSAVTFKTSRRIANKLGKEFVGKGYGVSRGPKHGEIWYTSKDGLRVYRAPTAKNSPYTKTGKQANFHQKSNKNDNLWDEQRTSNVHLDVSD